MPYHRSTVDVFSDGDFLILAHYDQKAFYLFDSITPDLAVTFHMDAYEDSQEVIVNHGMIHLIDRMSDHEIIYDYTNQTYLVASSSNQFQYLYDFKADDTTYRLYSENMDDLYLEIDGVRESVNYLDIIKKSDAGREILSVLDYKRNVVNEATVSCFYRDFMYYLRFQVRSNTTYSPSMLFAYDVMNDEVKYVTYDDDQVVGVYFTT